MTPEEAQRAIHDEEALRSNLPADCWRALETIAGMREEWGVTYTGINHGGRHIDWGPETREEAEKMARRYRRREGMSPVAIIRRYVTTPEEV